MLDQKIIYHSEVQDPFFNLALENYLLTGLKLKSKVLFTWTNSPCVVIGRFQNPWIECNLKSMRSENIKLVRRQSGGGTVYHDENNVNFSFISIKQTHDRVWNHEVVVDALEKVEIKSIATKRGDVVLDELSPRKISGSASKEKSEYAFHHGTMLIKSDLKLLNQFIHSDKQGVKTKSISSVRSKVANIAEINPSITNEGFVLALQGSFSKQMGIDCNQKIIVNNEHPLYEKIIDSAYYKSLISFEWIYKETPKFFIQENIDTTLIKLEIKKTIIESISLEDTNCNPIFLNYISETFRGKSIFELRDSIDEFNNDKYILSLMNWFDDYFDIKTLP